MAFMEGAQKPAELLVKAALQPAVEGRCLLNSVSFSAEPRHISTKYKNCKTAPHSFQSLWGLLNLICFQMCRILEIYLWTLGQFNCDVSMGFLKWEMSVVSKSIREMWIELSELKFKLDDGIVISWWVSNNAQVTMRRLSPRELGGAALLDMRPPSPVSIAYHHLYIVVHSNTFGNTQQWQTYWWRQKLHLWVFSSQSRATLRSETTAIWF